MNKYNTLSELKRDYIPNQDCKTNQNIAACDFMILSYVHTSAGNRYFHTEATLPCHIILDNDKIKWLVMLNGPESYVEIENVFDDNFLESDILGYKLTHYDNDEKDDAYIIAQCEIITSVYITHPADYARYDFDVEGYDKDSDIYEKICSVAELANAETIKNTLTCIHKTKKRDIFRAENGTEYDWFTTHDNRKD